MADMGNKQLYSANIKTPVGPMLALADEHVLYILEFVGSRHSERKIKRLQQQLQAEIVDGCSAPIELIKQELAAYFAGELTEFKTPLYQDGSQFQQQVWDTLQRIPSGKTCSYAALASAVGKPKAVRAAASANAANHHAIIIPCHRVISSDGGLGGYAGGLERKAWLLEHEKRQLKI